MSLFAAPDGSNQPFNTQTVQSFEVPVNGLGFLLAQSDAQWEQAVVSLIRPRAPT